MANPLMDQSFPQLVSNTAYPSDLLLEEVTVLEETLHELYPGLTDVVSKEHLAHRFDRMRQVASADSVPYTTWLAEIAMLTTDLGDLELSWMHSPNYNAWRQSHATVAPFRLDRHQGSWIIASDYSSEGSLTPGMVVESINGETMGAYLDQNAPLLPTQGNDQNVQAEWLEKAYSRHHTNFWERPKTYTLSGKGETVTVQGTTIDELETAEMLEPVNQRISYKNVDGVGIMGIPSLDDAVLAGAGSPYEQSFQLAFATAHFQNITDLVIDLRGTTGGKVKVVRELMRYLSDQPLLDSIYKSPTITIKHQHYAFSSNMMEPKFLVKLMGAVDVPATPFKGRVHLITNGDNYGVAGLLVAALAKRENTALLGEQAPVFDWGVHHGQYLLQMPFSKVIVAIPSTQLITSAPAANGPELVPLHTRLHDGPDMMQQVLAHIQAANS